MQQQRTVDTAMARIVLKISMLAGTAHQPLHTESKYDRHESYFYNTRVAKYVCTLIPNHADITNPPAQRLEGTFRALCSP